MSTLQLAERAAVAVEGLAWKASLGTGLRIGAGCDVIDVPAFRARLDRTPALLDRLLSPAEVDDARRGGVEPGSLVEARRLAARVAAKEAAYKAFGIEGLRFLDVEIVTGSAGAPHLLLHGQPANASVSLSHDRDVAMAVVVVTPHAHVPNPIDVNTY